MSFCRCSQEVFSSHSSQNLSHFFNLSWASFLTQIIITWFRKLLYMYKVDVYFRKLLWCRCVIASYAHIIHYIPDIKWSCCVVVSLWLPECRVVIASMTQSHSSNQTDLFLCVKSCIRNWLYRSKWNLFTILVRWHFFILFWCCIPNLTVALWSWTVLITSVSTFCSGVSLLAIGSPSFSKYATEWALAALQTSLWQGFFCNSGVIVFCMHGRCPRVTRFVFMNNIS